MITRIELTGPAGKPEERKPNRMKFPNEVAKGLLRENLLNGHKLIHANEDRIVLEKYDQEFETVLETTYEGTPRSMASLFVIIRGVEAFVTFATAE